MFFFVGGFRSKNHGVRLEWHGMGYADMPLES